MPGAALHPLLHVRQFPQQQAEVGVTSPWREVKAAGVGGDSTPRAASPCSTRLFGMCCAASINAEIESWEYWLAKEHALIYLLNRFSLICILRLTGVFQRKEEKKNKKREKPLFSVLPMLVSVGSILLLLLDSSKDVWKGFVTFQLGK